jgi:membrane peptidoglycan carboxypeptidase
MKRLLRIFLILCLLVVVMILSAIIILYPNWKHFENETIEMIEQHRQFETSHPGWSFPGKLFSSPASLQLPKERRIQQAKLRNYTLNCPAKKPGEYCDDGTIIPRGGIFAEGTQPPGVENWTRELAMEPIYLGPIIGPDSELREHLPIEDAPDHLIAALLHSEDAEFYEHSGVNIVAFLRAVVANLQGGSYKQGASTITMQVARNLVQRKEKTIERKLREIAFAVILDKHLSKKEILQMYIDMPYLGQDGSFSICGFASAAQFYFNKDIRDVTLDEAAILVGILPAPGSFRPDKFPDKAQEKRDRVLNLLKNEGWDVQSSIESPIPISTNSQLTKYIHPAYVQASISWLTTRIDPDILYGAGLNVHTAMDPVIQKETEHIFTERIKYLMKRLRLPKDPPLEAAAVLINPQTGYMEAVYGGTINSPYDFSRATQAKRQAGSSFKPMVFTLAFSQFDENGNTKWKSFDILKNQRKTFKDTNGWRPKNIGTSEVYSRTTTVANAITRSQNIATANLLEANGGPKALIAFAKDVGFDTSNFPEEMGIALGQAEVTPLEMAQFMAMISNGGHKVKGFPVISAYDLSGKNHIVQHPLGRRVINDDTAAMIKELMRLVIRYGTGGAIRGIGGKKGYTDMSIGKTGTTDKSKDLWFIGATPNYASAIWLGYDQPTKMRGTASDIAAPMWGWWMREVHKGIPVKKQFNGVKLKRRNLCRLTGQFANETCKRLPFPLLEGHKPRGTCPEEHPPPDPDKPKFKSIWYR